MKKRVVIYARFSSHSQTEQSIEGQLRECYDFARRNDYLVIAEYIDRALTGTTDKRPEFLRMIEDSKKKNFDYVLVYQLDRFARNRYDSANYKAKLKKNGVRVLSAKENITEDASGILVEGMLESMAEYYSAELSQKVRRGVKESLLKGHFVGGYGLFGYDIVDKKWTINAYEADIVRDMFTRYKNGEKAKEIIDRLNAQGIKTKAGSPFNMNSFARIIRNEKYIGVYNSHGVIYENVIPPIVDENLFFDCNAIMDEHKHKPRANKSGKPYILSGKLFCGCCGSLMTAETGTSHTGKLHHYYKCFGRKRNKHSCKKANYRQQDLEDLVFGTTVKYVLQPDVIQTVAEQVVSKFNSEITKTATLENLENELKAKEKAINALLAAIEQGIVTKSTKERLISLETQKEELESKISLEKAKQIKPLEVDKVKAFLNFFVHRKYENDQEKNEFFNSFINRVVLYDDKILIFYNTDTNRPAAITRKDTDDLLAGIGEKIEKRGKSAVKNEKNSLEPQKFKRVSLGGGKGIRTLVRLLSNGFQDRLVMTASISLRMGAAERGSPFHTLYFIIFLQVCQSFLEGFFRLAVRFLMLLPACVPDGGRLAQGRCCGLALLVSNHVGYCQRCSVGS